MAIETVIVAPVLAAMALGIFEVGSMVSRQQELQSAASEAEGIILAASNSETPTSSDDLKRVIRTSLGLREDQVGLEQRFRCNEASAMVEVAADCATTEPLSTYVRLQITDSYTPVWSNYGFGRPINYSVVRTVLVNTVMVS